MAIHQLSTPAATYVDKRRTFRDDFETRMVQGPVIFTANASGSTTTIVGALATESTNTNTIRLGEEFKLFTAAGVLKEEKVFRVTVVAVAGSKTVTFTPAAAVATASGDTCKLVGDANQGSTAEIERRMLELGFTQARINTMTINDMQYQIRILDDPGSLP